MFEQVQSKLNEEFPPFFPCGALIFCFPYSWDLPIPPFCVFIVLTALHCSCQPNGILIIFGYVGEPTWLTILSQPHYHRFAGKFAWPDQVLGISYPFRALAAAASCPNCPPRTGATFNLISSLKFYPRFLFPFLQFPNQRTKF